MTERSAEFEYVEHGVVATSGSVKGTLLTREEAARRGVTYEPLYRRVASHIGSPETVTPPSDT